MSKELPKYDLKEQEILNIIEKYSTPQKYPKRVITDKNTGNQYNFITFGNLMAEATYVNKQMFNFDGTKFVFKNSATGSIYEYDIVNETIRHLAKASCVYISTNNNIYYCNDGELWCMNWDTYETRFICSTPIKEYLLVTLDEKYASGTQNIQEFGKTGRQNLVTGEVEWIEHDFSANPHTCGIGHTNINPVYPEYLFFCNEGVTTHIPDRLWMYNYNTGKKWNFFVQAGPEDSIDTQETSGHEAWGPDGENMYWVKYTFDQNLNQSGLMRKNKEGTIREYINGDYSHWHCNPSLDNNWIVSDVNKRDILKAAEIGGCTIVLTNTNTYESWPIAYFEPVFHTHPYHPHPHISYNSKMIQWAMTDENDVLGVAWMDVSHITDDGRENDLIPLDENLTVVSNPKYGNFKTEKTDYNGETCYKVNGKMYVKLNNDVLFTPCMNSISFEVTCLDDGKDNFNFIYTSAAKSRMELAERENKIKSRKMSNTGKWVTYLFEIDDMALNDRCSHQTDFVISRDSDKPLYISKISVNYDKK